MAYVFRLVSILERLRDYRQKLSDYDQTHKLSKHPEFKTILEPLLESAEKRFQEFELDAALDRLVISDLS